MEIWHLPTIEVLPHHPQVLRSDEGATRVIVLALSAGDLLQEHQVHEHALLLVLEGELEIVHDGQRAAAPACSLLHFDPGERHEVRASSDARLLLFLSPWPGPGHPSLAVA